MNRIIAGIASIIFLAVATDEDRARRDATIAEIETILRGLIGTANTLTSWAILLVGLTPFAIALLAFSTDSVGLKAAAALLPILAGVLYLGGVARHPAIAPAAVWVLPQGDKVLKALLVTAVGELLLGFLFAAVPFTQDQGLLAFVLLGIFIILLSVLSGYKWAKTIAKIVGLVVALAIIVVFLGGRDGVRREIKNSRADSPSVIQPATELHLGCVVYEDVIEKQLVNGGKIFLDLSTHCNSPWIEVNGKNFSNYGCLDAQFLYTDGKVSDWVERCSGRRHPTQKMIKLVRFRPGADQPSDAWPVEVVVHPKDR